MTPDAGGLCHTGPMRPSWLSGTDLESAKACISRSWRCAWSTWPNKYIEEVMEHRDDVCEELQRASNISYIVTISVQFHPTSVLLTVTENLFAACRKGRRGGYSRRDGPSKHCKGMSRESKRSFSIPAALFQLYLNRRVGIRGRNTPCGDGVHRHASLT